MPGMEDDFFVGKRILLVGDNPESIHVLKLVFVDTFASLIFAEQEFDAVQICQNINPDVILIDVQTQKMIGYQMIEQMIGLHPNKCIIVMASRLCSDDKAACLRMGCKEYLVKPVGKDLLLSLIRKYVKKY